MNTIAKLTLGVLLFAGPLAMAGQEGGFQGEMRREGAGADEVVEAAPVEDSQEGPKLVEPARTVKEALERRSAEEAAAAKELEAARKAYEERLAAANQRTVADLTVIARRAVADGQLGDAARAFEEVLRLDPENEGAVQFFRTIGRLDEIEKRLAKISGDDRRVWRTTGSRVPKFVKQPDGTWLEILQSGRKKVWNEGTNGKNTVELRRTRGR